VIRALRAELARPTAFEWLCLLVGLGLVWTYAWFMDDAFVYFRYVDNLVWLGLGPVYNHGEWAEGYSSPLWVFLLAGVRATGLDYWTITRVLGSLSFAAFWLLLVRLQRRSAHGTGAPNLALAFLAGNYGVLCYFTSGLETPLVQLLAGLYLLALLRPATRGLDLVLALSPLVRQELVVALLLVIAWRTWRERRVPRRLVSWSALAGGGWLLFRVWAYADLFPTTYHLKNTLQVAQGLRYVHDTLAPYGLYPALALALGAWLWRRERGTSPWRSPELAALASALAVTLFVVKIGGDERHYRYLAFPLCLVVIVAAPPLERMLTRLGSPRARTGAGLAVLALSVAAYPRQLDRHPLRAKTETRLVDGIIDAEYHRHRMGLKYKNWGEKITPALQRAYRGAHPTFAYRDVSAHGWCKTAYVAFDERIVHSWGLTDAFLARVDAPIERSAHRPALGPMADDLVALIRAEGGTPGPGMFRRALAAGRAPGWVADNLAAIELIERKVYNRHDLLENLGLALRSPRLTPPRASGTERTRADERADEAGG
jgi:hypothetical protein